MKRKNILSSKPSKILKTPLKTLKIATWNICGLRSMLKKGTLISFLSTESPDILCLNETMLQSKHIEEVRSQIPSCYYQYYACSTGRKGYSGVAIFSLQEPLTISPQNNSKHDIEGRTLIAEFPNFFIVSTYVPNVGAELKRLPYRTEEWDEDIRATLKTLQEIKPVIWCGDFNVVHEDIDIYEIRGKEKYGCCTPEERGSFRKTLQETEMIDTFRELNPGVKGWSYFSRRNVKAKEKGQGWRIDYILISKGLKNQLSSAYMRQDFEGSDHYPCIAVIAENNLKL